MRVFVAVFCVCLCVCVCVCSKVLLFSFTVDFGLLERPSDGTCVRGDRLAFLFINDHLVPLPVTLQKKNPKKTIHQVLLGFMQFETETEGR